MSQPATSLSSAIRLNALRRSTGSTGRSALPFLYPPVTQRFYSGMRRRSLFDEEDDFEVAEQKREEPKEENYRARAIKERVDRSKKGAAPLDKRGRRKMPSLESVMEYKAPRPEEKLREESTSGEYIPSSRRVKPSSIPFEGLPTTDDFSNPELSKYKPLIDENYVKDNEDLFGSTDNYGRTNRSRWIHIFGNQVKRPSEHPNHIQSRLAAGETTITAAERETFKRIFSSILTKPQNVPGMLNIPFGPTSEEVTVGYAGDFRMPEVGVGNASTSEVLESSPEVMHYPPALRAMAALAIAKQKIKINKDDMTPEEVAHQEKVVNIMKRLQEAKTDHEVTEILEKEVFPMIDITAENLTERIALIGTTYSDLLTKALNLLRTRFEDYDGALWVFDRAKSMGAESYVVGCSADVYGEVIRAKWVGFRDIGGVVDLCHEMQSNGVEATEDFLVKIEATLDEFTRYEEGLSGQAAKMAICVDDTVAAQQLKSILNSWRIKWQEKWVDQSSSIAGLRGLGSSNSKSWATRDRISF